MDRVLSPVYQPIINVRTRQVAYYEALARINQDDSRGSHLRLLEMGEAFGFIDLIDIAMLKHAIRTATDHPKVKIAVNISVMTIEKALGELLSVIYLNHEIINRLVFEITETIELKDRAKMERFVAAVKVLQAKVAIDDYGDGFANLDLVKLVRPDFLKLPLKFIDHAVENFDSEPLTRLKNEIAVHGTTIIAEHIDSLDKFNWLTEVGINHAQGFLFGKYVPEHELSTTHFEMHKLSAPSILAA